jgi:hypothetical protein
MRTKLLAHITLFAAAIGLVACTDEAPGPPTVPHVRGVNASLQIACDFNKIKQDGKAYIALANDVFYSHVTNMQKASQASDWANVHKYGMLAEGRLADIRGSTAQKSGSTATDGGQVATDVAVCFDASTIGPIPDDFASKITLAMGKGGAFEVPGISIGTADGAYSRGETPFWAAEPATTWPTNPAGGFILYGFKDPAFNSIDPKVVAAFDHRTLPDRISGLISFTNNKLDLGACDVGILASTVRVQHITRILPLASLKCTGGDPWSPPTASLSLSNLNILSFFAPKPLHAAMALGAIGGGGSELLSPSVVVDMQNVIATFYSQPTGAVVGQTIRGTPASQNVQVKVTTLNGSPLVGATVTITVAGNSGTNVKVFNNVEVTVDPDGIATFDQIYVNKTGGYTLFATPSFDGVGGATVTSNLFNVQSK